MHTVVLSCGSDKVFLLKNVMVLACVVSKVMFLNTI
ncbi:conserved hypothetical protein [Aeromonas veronii]|uniref:Uncharacterized protein n=1 Tax=Aeromonas veronii TaxID=654 RepID=A0A653L6P0_AERVE|nr:conserved hypothetical protein [Aeromonas veronii]